MYTVKELSRLTGLTPRTLRYYDAIGLLSPARNRDNDYRLYGGAEVDRLQEILLYREMGLPLEEIGRILDAPDQLLQRDLEVDHRPQRLEMERCPLPAHGAPPRGDHRPAAVQTGHRPLLRIQKGRRPTLVQYLLEQRALPLLDQQVYVQELIAQQLGQKNAYRALPRAGHTNQCDVVQ